MSAGWMLGAVALTAILLRFLGAGYGLPLVFNSDEPHHVNIAVSFGRGSLNPGVFKYPTLWMYLLFAGYGAYFTALLGLGMLHSVREFGELFVWNPGGFYLIGRLLSAGLSLGGVWIVYRAGSTLGPGRGLWAAALLAVAPILIQSAHATKPDSLMFCLAAGSWLCALRYLRGGSARTLVACGFLAGLSMSAQYTAAPLALVPVAAWAARRPRGVSVGAAALAAFAGGFLTGSPFILLSWPAFARDLLDNLEVGIKGTAAGMTAVYNALTFAGPWAVCALALGAGAWRLGRRDRPLAALLLIPVSVNVALLAASSDGGWQRYLEGMFPALALVAAEGAEWARERLRAKPAAWLLLGAVCLPGGWESWGFVRGLLLPDTRALAGKWIESNVPEGARILADQEHSSPSLRMSRAQAKLLLRRTREAGHPRQAYYELMAGSHPGGGYEVHRILRMPSGLHSGRWHSEWSAQGRASLDVREGLKAARAAGIEFLVLSGAGADPAREPEFSRFLEEARRQGELLAEFEPAPGRVAGPRIHIYRIGK